MKTVSYALQVPAVLENLHQLNAFLEDTLSAHGCPFKLITQIQLSLEEAYVNIVNYAYGQETGDCKVVMEIEAVSDTQNRMTLSLRDGGVAFNPLLREDPDITLSAEERQIGGLGIFMIKKLMDAVAYERQGTENVLTMTKMWQV